MTRHRPVVAEAGRSRPPRRPISFNVAGVNSTRTCRGAGAVGKMKTITRRPSVMTAASADGRLEVRSRPATELGIVHSPPRCAEGDVFVGDRACTVW